MSFNKVSNFLDLYGESDEKVIEAIASKSSHIFQTFYVPGDFRIIIGSDKLEHYPHLEATLNRALYFEPILLNENLSEDLLDLKEKEFILTKMYKATLFLEIIKDLNAEFWLEFDLNELDPLDYRALAANLFQAFTIDEVNELADHEDEFVSALAYALYGELNEHYLIVELNNLLNYQISFDYLKAIHISNTLEEELKEVLISIATTLEVEVKYY